MSKQLIMESYVDECLDEVEIRDLFITEGIMSSRLQNIIEPLQKSIDYMLDDVSSLNSKIERNEDRLHYLKKRLLQLKDVEYPSSYYKGKILDVERDIKRTSNSLFNSNSSLRDLKANIQWKKIAIQKTRENPGLLGNIPILYTIIGATAIIAAIGYASYKLYKRFMSKAAKACQDKKGKTKTICMNQYQLKGLEASKKPFTDGIKNCSKAKDTQICKAKFNKKINAINKRITKKQNKIKKLMSK